MAIPNPHRSLAGQPGDRHQAAHPLCDLVYTRTVAIRAVLPEAGDAAVDDAGVHLPDRFVVDSEPVLDVGSIVLHDYVGVARQPEEDLLALRRFQIQRQAAFVAVQVLEIRSVAQAAG